jgi:hypothetical protein
LTGSLLWKAGTRQEVERVERKDKKGLKERIERKLAKGRANSQ